jgi:hypothetical protein
MDNNITWCFDFDIQSLQQMEIPRLALLSSEISSRKYREWNSYISLSDQNGGILLALQAACNVNFGTLAQIKPLCGK